MEKMKIARIILILICCLAASCNDGGLCSDRIIAESRSPNGEYVATLFERDCGATADFSRMVSIRPSNSGFVADNGRVFVVKGQPMIYLAWTSGQSLRIDCRECSSKDVFLSEEKWGEVQISH